MMDVFCPHCGHIEPDPFQFLPPEPLRENTDISFECEKCQGTVWVEIRVADQFTTVGGFPKKRIGRDS